MVHIYLIVYYAVMSSWSCCVVDGETFYNEDTCEDCLCSRGSVTCTPSTQCPDIDCTHPRTDTCCPSCTGCDLGDNATLLYVLICAAVTINTIKSGVMSKGRATLAQCSRRSLSIVFDLELLFAAI